MKIMITGSSGFIGSHLKEHFEKDEHEVIGWDRRAGKNIHDFKLEPDTDFVIHLAADADVRRSIEEPDELKRLGDRVLSKIKSGIGVLFNDGNDKPSAVIVVSDNLVKEKINAGVLAKQIGSFMGGGGGGKPHLATAGGRDSSAIKEAMEKTKELITNSLT